VGEEVAGAKTRTLATLTTPTRGPPRLQEAGHEVVTFLATGEGGRTMEKLIGPMGVSAMLDLIPSEIAVDRVSRFRAVRG